MKTCNKCGESKELEDFPIDRARADGRYPNCKRCHSEYEKERIKRMTTEQKERRRITALKWREENRERVKTRSQNNHLRAKYGIDLEAKSRLLEQQEGRCALCRGTSPRSSYGWHVDHDHGSGEIRGILCQTCNHVVGFIERGWKMPTQEEFALYLWKVKDALANRRERL